VLATGPNSRVGSGSGSTRIQTVAMDLTTRITQTVENGQVLPPTSRHFIVTMLALIKYLSSDHIMTWSVHTLCSSSWLFTFCCPICNRTNIRWVPIENPQHSRKLLCYCTAIQRILVRLQLQKREVEEQLTLHNLCTDHFIIRWDNRYLIGAKGPGTVIWNCGPVTIRTKKSWFMSGLGNKPAKT